MRDLIRRISVRSYTTCFACQHNDPTTVLPTVGSRPHSTHFSNKANLTPQRDLHNVTTGCRRQRFSTEAASSAADGNILRSPFPDEEIPNCSLADYLYPQINKFGSKTALIDNATHTTFTYSQLEDYCTRVGSFLIRHGYKKGDVLCYYGTNNPEFFLLMIGCSNIGVVLTTANPAYTPQELSRQMQHSGAKSIVTVPTLIENVKQAGIMEGNVIVVGSSEGIRPFSDVLSDDGKAFPTDVKINPSEDVVVLPYSSGTTGLPKGVMLTHRNIVANLIQLRKSLRTTPDDNNLGVLPFYHIYGMVPILLGTMQEGGGLITTPGFEPEAFLQTIVNQKITQIHIVPPIVLFLARHPMVEKYDLARLRTILSAAAPLGEGLSHEFMEKRKMPLKQGYGMTETGPVVAIDQEPVTVPSIGPIVCNTEAKFLHPDTGELVGRGEVGQLCVRGPQMMKGYLNNEEATQHTIDSDGWLHTGDIGYVLDNNCLMITDRLKELIKYKGFQIAPAELEDVIHKHPAVQDVAVIGVEDERCGEVPRAYVVCKPNKHTSEEDIAQFVEKNVSAYKKLRGGVVFRKEIPKNPSGKILRRLLKEA